MTFKQHQQITDKLRGPFWLSKVPVSLKRKTVRKSFRCGYKAVEALRKLKLDRADWYGADVADSNGTVVAELE